MHLSVFVILAVLVVLESAIADTAAPNEYVGRTVCTSCHAEQASQWAGSHHDMAMQEATKDTVLGNFANISLTHYGVSSLFFKKDGKYMVRTEGAQGKLDDFEIKYTFGVYPLQQYLIEFPGGRMQALGLAWDARPLAQGGQRWFHLYPHEKIPHDDELHWTKVSQNWNSMCAECHSTHLEKNYDAATRTYSTTWSEIDVSCEACHGPGLDHVSWAEQKPGWEQHATNKGLVLLLDERKGINWQFEPNIDTALRNKPRSTEKEIEMCARCHSRRSPITQDYAHGDRLMDHYLVRRLDEGMYFADGQMDDEVYVYGSFLQSKMYQAGVTCSDCHEPHSLALRAPGNGVCLQCHHAAKYDRPGHHFHKADSTGASCAECHMPPRDYMVVDPRHDHSMRVPRPDLSVKLGTPNACNQCHQDKSSEWAAEQVSTWYKKAPTGFQKYAPTLHAARQQLPDAGSNLTAMIRNTQTPDIARATALAQMGPYLNRETLQVLTTGLAHDNPMLRVAALTALETAPLALRVSLAFPLLNDPVRAVRIEVARALAAIPAGDLSKEQRRMLEDGIEEYVAAQQAMAERPEAQASLGNFFAARGEAEKAISAYHTATDLDPGYAPGYVNLADLYRSRGNETEAENVLRRAVKVVPGSADVHHALGLSLVRQKRTDEAVEEFLQASRLNPGNARYIYLYALALHSTGSPKQAVMVLQGAHNAHPHNTEILNALVAYHRDLGNHEVARSYAEKLKKLAP